MTPLEEMLNTLDLEAYLEEQGVDYRPQVGSRGVQLNVRECPCCGNSNWKVYLNAETGLGNCFSGDCERKFNKFTFIRALNGFGEDNRKTIEHIQAAALSMGWRPPRKTAVATTRPSALVIPTSYAIPIEGKNIAYLKNRGISIDYARYFQLRYCHEGWFNYKGPNGENYGMNFSKRILIPVFDLEGKMVSFQGRDITGTAEKKYLFPPGFAATGVHLFNGQNVHNTKRVVVGEGVFDVIALKMAMDSDPALRDVVPIGTFGKHLSGGQEDDQLAKFLRLKTERGIEEVVLMWDSETRATDDAIVAGRMLQSVGLRVRIAQLPKDKDPNEVPAAVVCQAFYAATSLTGTSALKLAMSRRVG